MAGRFPGAPDVDTLWRARRRRRGLPRRPRPRSRCVADGVPRARAARPRTTCAAAACSPTSTCFDAGFFGIGPRDAAIMDPQHRHFLESAWEALEIVGPRARALRRRDRRVRRLRHEHLHAQQPADEPGPGRAGRHVPAPPHRQRQGLLHDDACRTGSTCAARRVNVQTACSTSLVAVHLAVQSLLAFECDMALAGGVDDRGAAPASATTTTRARSSSPDGALPRVRRRRRRAPCSRSGAGVVALRRLADAIDDGDPILAVIKGTRGQQRRRSARSATSRRASTATPTWSRRRSPSPACRARDISLLEAHGTGTAVGDPIEVAALTEAFRESTERRRLLPHRSTKPNIGHLDTAAGVASLIKVVQALRHRTLPPLANHTAPSPLLDVDTVPVRALRRGRAVAGRPARAAPASARSASAARTPTSSSQEAPPPPATPPAVPEQIARALRSQRRRGHERGRRQARRLPRSATRTRTSPTSPTRWPPVAARIGHRRVVGRHRHGRAPSTLLRTNDRNRVATTTAADDCTDGRVPVPGRRLAVRRHGAPASTSASTSSTRSLRDGIERVKAQSRARPRAAAARPTPTDDALRRPDGVAAGDLRHVESRCARQWMAWGVDARRVRRPQPRRVRRRAPRRRALARRRARPRRRRAPR